MNGICCTTIEQSKRLLSFRLNPESADLSWYRATEMYPYQLDTLNKGHGRMEGDDLIPAWSLNALLEVLPRKIELHSGEWDKRYDYVHRFIIESDEDNKKWKCSYKAQKWFAFEATGDTVIEAVYSIVEKMLSTSSYLINKQIR